MPSLLIPSDAFSHGQIKSKLWLCENFSLWLKKYLSKHNIYTLNWYGSWVGIGPMLLLSQNTSLFSKINLFDLNDIDLAISGSVLDYWKCESIEIKLHNVDINSYEPTTEPNQIFINTSCEHILDDNWLKLIPTGSNILLQSTDMPHLEHINNPQDLNHFTQMYSDNINVLEVKSLAFDYPDKKFNRYMLFGTKK
ncbi:MAG: hypothetical protein ABL930_06685 [Pseudobdellovibrio sp.]